MVVVQAEHEAGRCGVPVMVARRRVQFAAPRGHGVQFAATTAVAADDATAAVTDIADNDAAAAATTAAQRAQRWLPRCRDRGVSVAAGRAARPVAGAGHRPSVFFRRHHRDAFRAHRRPIRVRQRACAICTIGWRVCGPRTRVQRENVRAELFVGLQRQVRPSDDFAHVSMKKYFGVPTRNVEVDVGRSTDVSRQRKRKMIEKKKIQKNPT